MEPWEVVVRERVHDTVARYAHAADGGRAAELADCFAEDGVLVVYDQHRFQGREAILRLLEASGRRQDLNSSPTTHLVSGLLFERVPRARTSLPEVRIQKTALYRWLLRDGRSPEGASLVSPAAGATRRSAEAEPVASAPGSRAACRHADRA